MENTTVLVPFCGLTAACTKENGAIVEKTARANLLVIKAQYTKVNGSKESTTAVVNCKRMKVKFLQALSRMANISAETIILGYLYIELKQFVNLTLVHFKTCGLETLRFSYFQSCYDFLI